MIEPEATDYQKVWIDGTPIRVGVCRRGREGLPVLMFNGIGGSMELLEPFIQEMRNTTVICYDVPGAGESPAPSFPWRPKHHAHLAAKLLDHLKIGQVNVLGISWGGMLAQQFARQFPQRVERLVLAATSPGQIMIPAKLSVLMRMSNPLRYFSPDYMERLAPIIYGGSLRTNKLGAKEHARKMKPPSIKGYYFQLLSLVGWSSLPWLHKLKLPTLILAGDDDPIIPIINAKVMAARIPQSVLRVVDCGHLFLLTRAKILAPEIESFFADA